MNRSGGAAVAVLMLVAGLATGCVEATEPTEAAPPGVSTSSSTTERSPGQDESRKPSMSRKKTGAAGRVSEAEIMMQLRDAAERIAQRTPVEQPAPADIEPDSNRALGYELMLAFGFPPEQWKYLDALWHRESGWNHLAENPSSGAYGIPQSLPANKMAVVGADYRTNPDTQIRWGLAYIASRYGSPQGAWAHSERHGWY